MPLKRFQLCCSLCGPLEDEIIIYKGDTFVEEYAEVNHFLKKGCSGRVSFGDRLPLFEYPPPPPRKRPRPSAGVDRIF